MIEKIGLPEYAPLSVPCEDVVLLLDRMLADDPASVSVAEVGVGIGATSCEIVRRLRPEDSFYFFSFVFARLSQKREKKYLRLLTNCL